MYIFFISELKLAIYLSSIRKMTLDRNTIVTLHKKGHSNSSIARSCIFAVKRFARWEKSSIRQGKYAIDQVRVENIQSELILKGDLATRIELDFPRKAACRMRSFRG